MSAKSISFPLVLLAGGKGSRAGMPKGLIEYNGRPWLEQQLREFRAIGGSRVVVVLGHQAEDYLRVIPSLEKEEVVVNPTPEHGQFSSLRAGLQFLAQGPAFVLPVDTPVADRAVWLALESALDARTQACVPEWQGRGGHPVLLARDFCGRLMSLPPESRLDLEIKALGPDRVKRVPVEDARVCMNFNTQADWKTIA